MARIIIVLFLGLFANTSFSAEKIIEIRPGDVILLPLNCYSCQILESETQSPFSHSGVVLEDEKGDLVVAEALRDTHWMPLEKFLERVPKNKSAAIYRSKELQLIWEREPVVFDAFVEQARKVFLKKYKGLGFDKKYLWDNVDENGKELLYCSEFVSKFLNEFLTIDINPTPMSFTRHWDFWVRYYGGVENVPEGKLGNSPAYFSRTELFFFVQYLGN